jgi:hypothetical protein
MKIWLGSGDLKIDVLMELEEIGLCLARLGGY